MNFISAIGIAMVLTILMLSGLQAAETCTTCAQPDDGGFGSLLLLGGGGLFALGLLPSVGRAAWRRFRQPR